MVRDRVMVRVRVRVGVGVGLGVRVRVGLRVCQGEKNPTFQCTYQYSQEKCTLMQCKNVIKKCI
jgi:hypothetical protein